MNNTENTEPKKYHTSTCSIKQNQLPTWRALRFKSALINAALVLAKTFSKPDDATAYLMQLAENQTTKPNNE